MIALHSKDGRHFLGLRRSKAGQYEIVYDNARQGKRLIWKVVSKDVSADTLGSQLHEAIKRASVLDALLAGLHDAEIAFEVDYDWATQAATGRK
jgi:hypothetical protein